MEPDRLGDFLEFTPPPSSAAWGQYFQRRCRRPSERQQRVPLLPARAHVEGNAKNFVPETDDVLYHTALIGPDSTDTIFFTAPTTPGEYEFVCTFPGHASMMKGILRVEP